MLNFLNKLLKLNERELNKIRPLVTKINSHEQEFEKLNPKELKAKTAELRGRLVKGQTLDDLLPEAFALVREAFKRTMNGVRLYDVQMIGGIALHQGKIAEMRTGEGKTFVASLPLYLNALEGKGAHLVTVNDYLAKRDAEWVGPVFHELGLSVGVINHEVAYLYDPNPKTKEEEENEVKLTEEESSSPDLGGLGAGKFMRTVSQKEAYAADITYGTNNEFGFDYLRDNMVTNTADMRMRELHYAIVDEVDSILIDEARTPLIISAPKEEATDKYYQFAKLIKTLNPKIDYILDEKAKSAVLTEIGISKVERALGVQNLYEKDFETVHHIEEALKAETLFKKDRDYVVRDGEVIIVDEFTGRLMFGRRYSEGLHQAIEAKENVKIQRESQTLATISFQNLFRLYKKLAGMTGTASTESEEFHKIYGLEVVEIPTNKPVQRKDFPDFIYKTEGAKWEAIVAEIEEKSTLGQPVLVGTTAIDKNELLSTLLKRKKIAHEVLNAKNHEKEAHIIAQAGQKGAITIATNIAGRGVDIKLGENVANLGGLHIIGSERHEARRIDNQLRGRSGRQGDPGSSRFYVSLQDDIMRLFGGDRVKSLMDTLRLPDDTPIESGMVSKSIESAQSRVEGHNFDIRKHVVEYDDVMNKQREVIYGLRKQILHSSETEEGKKELRDEVISKIKNQIENIVNINSSEKTVPNTDVIVEDFATIIPFDENSKAELNLSLQNKLELEIINQLRTIALDIYAEREKDLGETLSEIEKTVYLNIIDTLWIEHLDDIDDLREGIGLRGYGQRDPLVEYKNEAYILFERLMASIDFEMVHRIYKIHLHQAPTQAVNVIDSKNVVVSNPEVDTAQSLTPAEITITHKPASSNIQPSSAQASTSGKIGRNDPCPCGSGLKFKKCGLINASQHKG